MNQERQKEQQHVDQTIALIDKEATLLKQQQQLLTGQLQDQLQGVGERRIRGGDEEAFYESVLEYRQYEEELLLKYHTADSVEKRLKTLQTMNGNPYFARIDFTEDTAAKETLYLGISSLRDQEENAIVIDWRAPIANLYYEGELGPTYYETDTERYEVDLLLKRQFKIQGGQITSMVDTTDVINDEFLLEILDEASSSQMKNIVSTIQQAQNQIIRDTHSKIMLIEGIAGSGKTSALLQRIAFLLYRHRKWLKDDQVLLFSPNHLFSDYISMVLPSLGESEVPTRTFRSFMQQLLPTFTINQEAAQEEVFLTGAESRTQRLKSGLSLIHFSHRYLQAITDLGPLFRDLKIKGKTYITASQMRHWYKETNPQLPLYQRTQLLQTKLLKKAGGLHKDEGKKQWVKELTEERLQEYYADHPNADDSEKSERRLRNQIRKAVLTRYFRPVVRAIEEFRFINFSKQYLHFLQSVPSTLLSKAGISSEAWSGANAKVRSDLKIRHLDQEDAVLFFLLCRGLYPADVPLKARFIFVDEMQDFPPAQVALLRSLYPKAGLTLCGDLNQKVFGNETIVSNLEDLFSGEEVTRYQLTTSYRSTKEITDFANQFLSQEDQVELTARTGDLPLVVTSPSIQENLTKLASSLTKVQEDRFWRTAIICKTKEECRKLYDNLPAELQEKVQLIVSEDDFMKRPLILIPAFLAKGLEFDRVFAWNIGENFITAQDRLILYTICTRAMHELTLFTQAGEPSLLDQANSASFRKE